MHPPKAPHRLPNGTLVLAGDIGGTKTNLALLRAHASKDREELVPERRQRFESGAYPTLYAMLREFLGDSPPPLACAGFGVPGPVKNGRAKATNLTWGIDAQEIRTAFEIPVVEVLNDLAANAYGITELAAEDFAMVQEGAPDAEGNRCVVSPGTGLGEAGLFWDGHRYHVWACEGGHSDFSARSEVENALLNYLQKIYGHVSMERVVSGMGLLNIYSFLRDTGRGLELPEVKEALQTGSPGKVITENARRGICPMCEETLEIFISCLGAEAGNMALKAMATGGVYLGGGIPAKLLEDIQSTRFLHSFNHKGRLQGLMEAIPVRVILNDDAALLGAARYAADSLG
jgi:glucokinase